MGKRRSAGAGRTVSVRPPAVRTGDAAHRSAGSPQCDHRSAWRWCEESVRPCSATDACATVRTRNTRAVAAVGRPQDALVQPGRDEVLLGPISMTQPVQGIPLNVKTSAFLSIKTENNSVVLRVRAIADLADLQAKIAAIIDTAPLPTNNCDAFGLDNIVARIWGKRLDVSDTTAILRLNDDVDGWACVKNPIPCTKLVWVNDGPCGLTRPKIESWECNPAN
jgi:hypothetical protein